MTNYTYNANNWLTGKTNKKTDNTVLSQYTYSHYRDGNIYQENAGFKKEDNSWQTQNRTYAYDPQGRLKQVTEGSSVTSYTYDLRGNRLTKATGTDTTSYTYDLNNRLLSEAEGDTTTLYEYDDRGNLVSKRKETITSDTTTSDSASILTDNFSEDVELYTYNGFNQLSEYRTGGTKASYTYNAEGIRTSKTVNGNTTQFLLNGANVIGEIGANNQVTHYIRGVSGIIYSIDGSYAQSTKKYYTTNGHGDVVGLLDNAGVLTKSYTYDPFGVEQNIDTNDTNPFRYCGEYFDNESKDLYLRARYYSPATGRFTQQDPAMADGMNWYNYCGGNPVNAIDPWGLDHYIFYDTDHIANAESLKEQLLENDPDTPVHLIRADTDKDFYKGWSAMGVDEDGNAVPIDYVLIVVHGEPGYVKSSYGQPIYADKLEKKTIDTIFISACNTGNMDFEDNFASQLAMSQDVKQVIAPDGYGKYYNTGFPYSSEYYDDLGVLTGREGNGIIVYQNVNGKLVITTHLVNNKVYRPVLEIIDKGRAVGAQNRLKARAEALFSDPGNIPRFPRPDHYNPNPGPFPLR